MIKNIVFSTLWFGCIYAVILFIGKRRRVLAVQQTPKRLNKP